MLYSFKYFIFSEICYCFTKKTVKQSYGQYLKIFSKISNILKIEMLN